MAKPGPARMPTHLKLMRGETRPSRLRNEPEAPLAEPVVPPDYLDADAMAVWHRLAPSLQARAMLTAWDVDQFAAYCTAVVHHRRAVQLVNSTNVLIKARGHDQVVKHPALQVVRDQASIMATLASRFGLTPGDRANIEAPSGAQDDGSSILD